MSAPPLGRAAVRAFLDERGLSPSRALGQNFVVDPNTTERIARLAGIGTADTVVEIGAGLGALTVALAARSARVVALELDRGLAAALREMLPAGIEVREQDALRLDWSAMSSSVPAPEPGGHLVVVANLPYNIATPLVMTILEQAPGIERLVVMVQREVAERLAAGPGGREYGAVSVRVAYFASSRVLGHVSAEVFHPRPRVESTLVELERRPSPAVGEDIASYAEIVSLVRAGFAGRRKMLRRSLAGLVDEAAFAAAGVAPSARPEELGVVAWGTLAACQRATTS